MNVPIKNQTPMSKSEIASEILKSDKKQEELEKVIAKNESTIQDKIPASAKESTAKVRKESKMAKLLRFLFALKDTFCL